ncbi:MAG TPA: hypothetical protein VKW06_22525 [Candidatus Angelobacter sp.]|nr:hypothetical protein [Candidatus Angelobacter sp.]
MPTDDQIRELCAQVVSATGADFETAIRDLQSAIRYRLEDLSNQAIATLLMMPINHASGTDNKTKSAAAGGEDEDLDKVS